MLETFLLNGGFKCGTIKNLSTVINEAMLTNTQLTWYFLTPLKPKDNGSGFKEVTINFAYPFIAELTDITEDDVFNRLKFLTPDYEKYLLKELKKIFLVPSYTFSVVPFWSNREGIRIDRKDFSNVKIHILSAQLTLRYRDAWINCQC